MLDKWSNESFLLSENTCKQACWSDYSVITGPHIAKIFQRWALYASPFKDAPFTNSSLWPLLCSFKRQRGCDSLQQFLELSGGKKKKKKRRGCRVQTVINIHRRGRGERGRRRWWWHNAPCKFKEAPSRREKQPSSSRAAVSVAAPAARPAVFCSSDQLICLLRGSRLKPAKVMDGSAGGDWLKR